ncbi:U-scoloptoxin(16)-Ssd1a-like [Coccinella septempunctata]|uniref:U-scoloptoxin(16)-Ssd1a-like n=1 Tax=Coccinella septempunctata TaxID=41139 RepID=UPI001D0668C0|nr:U-scoloptoxin(16)-Ssd1a-like [Coccinella septempunctata]
MKALYLLFFLCILTFTYGWVSTGITDKKKMKGHPNQCWTEEVGYVDIGKKKNIPKRCAELSCEKNGRYIIQGCGAIHVQPKCQVKKGDQSKPYPDCCFKIKC